jgi:dTMP kinase
MDFPTSHCTPHPSPPCPRFVVFEGIDGSGKSTQAGLLADRMRREGFSVVLTSEPSEGPVGALIKSLTVRPQPEEEAHLFTEDRRDHLRRVIIPALNGGSIVICDRYVYSSAAYQGARGVDPAAIIRENCAFALRPHVTFLLEISVEEGLARIGSGRANGFSTFEVREDLEKVAKIYSELSDPTIVRIDGLDHQERIHEQIVRTLNQLGLRLSGTGRGR